MRRHDRRPVRWLTWVGEVRADVTRYRCATCRAERRPLLETLEVELGQPSGWLARQLGVLGCVASYPLAAQLAGPLFGLTVNAMTVWRAVQRLGEAAAQHTETLGAYHADPRSAAPDSADAPDAVVVAVDGCMLGMQVRATRRRRRARRYRQSTRGTSAKAKRAYCYARPTAWSRRRAGTRWCGGSW